MLDPEVDEKLCLRRNINVNHLATHVFAEGINSAEEMYVGIKFFIAFSWNLAASNKGEQRELKSVM